ncbi:Uma2 family endonuclease [Geminocystis herdmanii]|uniref:Uma2 family endonuclease n=1 Tax=Geminocystis herdmanii TaxID=669359 RepID=UPI00034634BD|nr:Uma2 family endonuclease [Geminocystis herdmanii]
MTATILQNPSENLTPKSYYTPEEYLAFEENSKFKHEYRNGEIVPMTGETTNHNEIAGNFYANLKTALKGQNYRVFFADVRLWIPRYRQYTYPDVIVIQGKPVYDGKGKTTVTNPFLIMEVLSKSTQDYDKGTKFDYYRSISELQEYILIDQYHIQKFTKNTDNNWVLRDIENPENIVNLESLKLQISLKDLYDNVDFNDSEDKD